MGRAQRETSQGSTEDMWDTDLSDGAAELVFQLLVALAHQVRAGSHLARSQLVLEAM